MNNKILFYSFFALIVIIYKFNNVIFIYNCDLNIISENVLKWFAEEYLHVKNVFAEIFKNLARYRK